MSQFPINYDNGLVVKKAVKVPLHLAITKPKVNGSFLKQVQERAKPSLPAVPQQKQKGTETSIQLTSPHLKIISLDCHNLA